MTFLPALVVLCVLVLGALTVWLLERLRRAVELTGYALRLKSGRASQRRAVRGGARV